MIVTIWRHGEAASAATDRQRELTDGGRDDIAFGCHRFHDTCIERGLPHPDLILHSSWLRTSQTAEIIDSAFSHAKMRTLDALIPGSRVAEVDRAVDDILAMDQPPVHLVLVSHQPLVSRLVDHYLDTPGKVPPLSPGGFAVLELDVAGRGCAELLFWALPDAYEAHV